MNKQQGIETGNKRPKLKEKQRNKEKEKESQSQYT